ncbi:MAG: GGDEF domain-containing protein [Burkholderiaceae bacterium]
MSKLVDHLAALTGSRDRELLDMTLVGALRDLLRPLQVTIYRSIGELGNERWLTRARLHADDLVATADPDWIDTDSLPLRTADPARLDAFERQAVVVVPGSNERTLFPLETERETLGVIEIESEAPLAERDRRLVLSILRIYRNFQGLLDYSERDTLTGLLNRKTFDNSFLRAAVDAHGERLGSTEGRRSAHARCNWWLGVIDIDHFKKVNDSHGHLIGDEVLLLLSRVMRNSFRCHDRLYRFGGEEFVVLMRCADGDTAIRVFERLRTNVERYAFPQVGCITVSVGVAELKAGDSPSSAFERADKAVYYAKEHGRNQVREHSELVARGELIDKANTGDVELF